MLFLFYDFLLYMHAGAHESVHIHVHTWIRERILAKWESIAPPCGKFWFILFINSVKQLNAMTSVKRTHKKEGLLATHVH